MGTPGDLSGIFCVSPHACAINCSVWLNWRVWNSRPRIDGIRWGRRSEREKSEQRCAGGLSSGTEYVSPVLRYCQVHLVSVVHL